MTSHIPAAKNRESQSRTFTPSSSSNSPMASLLCAARRSRSGGGGGVKQAEVVEQCTLAGRVDVPALCWRVCTPCPDREMADPLPERGETRLRQRHVWPLTLLLLTLVHNHPSARVSPSPVLSATMSNREPMWYCHEVRRAYPCPNTRRAQLVRSQCHAEMRPLMVSLRPIIGAGLGDHPLGSRSSLRIM